MSKRSPRELNCERLKGALSNMKNRDVGCVSYMKTRVSNAMHSVCWALSQWRRECEQHRIVPGVCMDCKGNANDYSLSLVTMNTRNNYGLASAVFMGFLADETFETFIWQFRCFNPCMIAMDQQSACLGACRQVFRNTYITLDDWHLNQNQVENVWRWLCKIGKRDWNVEVNDELFLLRNSGSPESFQERSVLEAKYDTPFTKELSEWYKSLYHTQARVVVSCYKKRACDPRFLFQGSGYSESSNTIYQRLVTMKEVPIYEVPFEMKREAENQLLIREVEKLKSNERMLRKLRGCQLGIPPQHHDRFV